MGIPHRFPYLWRIRRTMAALEGDVTGKGLAAVTPAEVRSVTAPTLVVVGQHTSPILCRVNERLVELLPNVRRATISNASHLMHEDNPDETNRVMLEFLGAQVARAAARGVVVSAPGGAGAKRATRPSA